MKARLQFGNQFKLVEIPEYLNHLNRLMDRLSKVDENAPDKNFEEAYQYTLDEYTKLAESAFDSKDVVAVYYFKVSAADKKKGVIDTVGIEEW